MFAPAHGFSEYLNRYPVGLLTVQSIAKRRGYTVFENPTPVKIPLVRS
jgi:hypothetical protein